MISYSELRQNVIVWAGQRGIYEHSTAQVQAIKCLEEFGELCAAILKDRRDDLKDALGDMVVCLINYAQMTGLDDGRLYAWAMIQEEDVVVSLADFSQSLSAMMVRSADYRGNRELTVCFSAIKSIASTNHVDLEECFAMAWNAIKDRKGKMTATGAFVKEEDL